MAYLEPRNPDRSRSMFNSVSSLLLLVVVVSFDADETGKNCLSFRLFKIWSLGLASTSGPCKLMTMRPSWSRCRDDDLAFSISFASSSDSKIEIDRVSVDAVVVVTLYPISFIAKSYWRSSDSLNTSYLVKILIPGSPSNLYTSMLGAA